MTSRVCPELEAHAVRRRCRAACRALFALELQRRVGLEEMIMRADLDRPVAAVGDRERHGLAAGVERSISPSLMNSSPGITARVT